MQFPQDLGQHFGHKATVAVIPSVLNTIGVTVNISLQVAQAQS